MISCFRIFSVLLIITFFTHLSWSQTCVGNLPSNITLSWSPSTAIETNFNNARRLEEAARSIPANSLGSMAAPSAGWENLSYAEMALYIHNSERVARGCAPFYGVEVGLSNISQAHSDWQISNNVFNHTGNSLYGTGGTYTICPAPVTTVNGSTMNQRVNYTTSPVKNCYEYLAENVSLRASSSTNSATLNNPVASAIFEWIYRDASSSWGHRSTIFKTYTNNNGAANSEGFIGVGVATEISGVNFTYAPSCGSYAGVRIVTIDYYDPQAAPSCSFSFSAILPVELLSFSAQKNKSFIDVKWETASEHNSDYFLVERSSDGIIFEPIGQVSAAGESQSIKNYLFQDKAPLNRINFYRLIEIDRGGTETLSKIISVQNGSQNQIQLYPNPTKDYFVLLSESKEEAAATIEVRNSTGNLVYQQGEIFAGNNAIRISTEFLTPGVYWVTVIFDNLKSETLRMVKL